MASPVKKEDFSSQFKQGWRERRGKAITVSVDPETIEKMNTLREVMHDGNISRCVTRVLQSEEAESEERRTKGG
jgi:hypothetical protein